VAEGMLPRAIGGTAAAMAILEKAGALKKTRRKTKKRVAKKRPVKKRAPARRTAGKKTRKKKSKGRLKKGSPEAKRRMKQLRAMQKRK